MLKVGLTGGIGCGKSTAVDAFRVLGATIIDADQISKDLVKAGSLALVEIAKEFGSNVLLSNGDLNRARLKEIVFSDPQALDKLEAIIHPRVQAEINKQMTNFANDPYVIVDIPLLVEKGYANTFDRIVVVDCLPEQQIARVSQRDDINVSTIESIMAQQASRDTRLNAATDILDNLGSIEALEHQVEELHKAFLNGLNLS